MRRSRTARGESPHNVETSDSRTVPEYSIDELGAAAGVPSRTVRLYQSEGLLPPPTRKGRVGVYGPSHLERLRLIAQLQDRGLRLRGIRDALHDVAKGRMTLDEWLGVEAHLRTPWSTETAVLLSETELGNRLGGRPPGFVASLIRAGLLERQGERLRPTYLIPSPGLFDIALQLDAAGIDIETGARARELIRRRIRRAAAEVVAYFAQHTGAGFARAGTAPDIAEALNALRTVGAQAVRILFTQEIETAVRTAMDRGLIPGRLRPRA